MTTNELRHEHLTDQIRKLQNEKSQLQGEVHQLLLDIQTMHKRDKEHNLEINQLQERCCTCGVGGNGR